MRLLTIGSLPPEWGGPVRGGAATFHAALLTELLKRDGEVEIVGVLPPGPPDREIPVPAYARPQGVSRARFYEELLERLRPDAVLMNHFAHTIGVTHARLGSPVPAVGVAQSWHQVTFRSGPEREHAAELTREALAGLGAMVAVSHHTLEEGRRLGFEMPPFATTIHNPVPPLYMGDDLDVMAPERHGVLYLGSLIPRKEPAALVEAAAALPGLDVSLVGEGELEADLRALIDDLGLGHRVRLAALPPGADHLRHVRELLLRSRLMCLPSRSEGLPLAFVEALACGTPIVGFGPAVREIRDELGIDVGEPLDTGAPEEIAAALERVRTRSWDRAELRRATLAHFGLDRVADRYVDLLSRASARRDGASSGAEGRSNDAAASPAARFGATPAAPRTGAQDATAVCVLGMSRAGTSLTARLLGLAGVYLGSEEELLGKELHQLAAEGEEVLVKATGSNPAGHWEHYRLMRLNERILRRLGGSWRDPPQLPPGWEVSEDLASERLEARVLLAESFADHALWAWKDPRNSLTLPFWRQLLPRMRHVICVRNPVDVAASLQRRDGIPPEWGVDLWLTYLAAALVNTAGRPRLIVRYESYFEDPTGTAARLARFAGCEGTLSGPVAERRLAEAIDERLWRNRAGSAGSDAVSSRAASLFRILEMLASPSESGDDARDRLAALNAAADVYAAGILRRPGEEGAVAASTSSHRSSAA